jgi:hypothetical protein
MGVGRTGTFNEAGLLPINHALLATKNEKIDLDFSFKATSIGGVITRLDELFGTGRYDTTWGYVQGSIAIGTAQGLADLGTATTRRSPNSGWYDGVAISISDLKSVWITTHIDIYGGNYSGEYAEMGYNTAYRPGYLYAFSVGEATETTVPESTTLSLLIIGLLGFSFIRRRIVSTVGWVATFSNQTINNNRLTTNSKANPADGEALILKCCSSGIA